MLDMDKGNKINDAEDKLDALDQLLKDLATNKDDSMEHLAKLTDEISDAKMTGSKDPDL